MIKSQPENGGLLEEALQGKASHTRNARRQGGQREKGVPLSPMAMAPSQPGHTDSQFCLDAGSEKGPAGALSAPPYLVGEMALGPKKPLPTSDVCSQA